MLEGGFLVGNSLFCNRMSCFYRQWLFEFLCFLLKHEIYRDFFEWRLSFRETINAHISPLTSALRSFTVHPKNSLQTSLSCFAIPEFRSGRFSFKRNGMTIFFSD